MPTASRLSPERASFILREVPPEKAFHFYSAIDSPLNVSARSLKEFLQRINTIEPVSLAFHAERRDFESWVSMLGDNDLASKLAEARISKLQDEALRVMLYNTTKNRVDQLDRLGTKTRR